MRTLGPALLTIWSWLSFVMRYAFDANILHWFLVNSQLKQAKDMMANLKRLLAFAELPSGAANDQTRPRWRPSSAILPDYSERNDHRQVAVWISISTILILFLKKLRFFPALHGMHTCTGLLSWLCYQSNHHSLSLGVMLKCSLFSYFSEPTAADVDLVKISPSLNSFQMFATVSFIAFV